MVEKKPNTYINAFKLTVNALLPLYDEQEASAIAKQFLEDTISIARHEIFTNPDHPVSETDQTRIEKGIKRLRKGEPLQYVVGTIEFMEMSFSVTPDVLIPRPETEELIRWIASDLAGKKINILDIGTGSGCIAICLARLLPDATVYATDISEKALALAAENAKKNNQRVEFIHNDILNSSADLPPIQFDVVVSNPPYITEQEKRLMHSNVLEHEPHLALFVPNEDPLRFYKAISTYVGSLQLPVTTYLEINEAFGSETAKLFSVLGFETVIKKDIHDKERMVRATTQA